MKTRLSVGKKKRQRLPGPGWLVVIGASLGGLEALQKVLSGLKPGFPGAVAIVQHREKHLEEMLSGLLQKSCALPVSEAEDKEIFQPGRVYLASANYHLLVENSHFALSTDEPVFFARPSVDVLFESAAEAFGERVIGVILTGANQDGARGLAAVRAGGGLALVQDPAEAVAPNMPEAAIAVAGADRILPLKEIGPFIDELCRGKKRDEA